MSFLYVFLPRVYMIIPQTVEESLAIFVASQISSMMLEFVGDVSLG